MSPRQLFALVAVCAPLTLGGLSPLPPGESVPLQETGSGGGVATHINDGICYWQCNDGTVGSGPVAPPGMGNKCLNLCAADCGGPCIPLY